VTALCAFLGKWGPLIARILLAQLFLISGFGKVMSFAKTAGLMATMGLPMPTMLLVLTIALELGGGALLVLGWQTRWVAAALFVFTFLTAVVFHAFWNAPPAQLTSQLNNFMKNLSIMGGMLYVIVYGAGPLALDRAAAPPPTKGGSHAGKKS
jgi:putative oxidoreductase